MDKKRAVELLIQEVEKIPYLKTLPSNNDEFRLWLKNVENIINKGLEPEDKNKYQEASQFLKYLRGIHEEDLIQQDYIDEIIRYEIAFKAIVQKYEILGITGERDKGGEFENKMNKKEFMTFLNEKMQKVYELETLPPDNVEFPKWYKTIEGYLYKVFSKDSWEYMTFKEAGLIRGIVEDSRTQYLKDLKSRETALASIIETHEKLGDEESPEQEISVRFPLNLFDAMHFHPKVVEASKSLFESKHYAQAIFEAFKAVENFVKDKSGLSLYGKNLMARAFDEENPVIKVPEAGYFDKDVQEGFKFLFMGATLGIRNPKAHKDIIQKDPYITLEYLGFASFLLKRIDYWEARTS